MNDNYKDRDNRCCVEQDYYYNLKDDEDNNPKIVNVVPAVFEPAKYVILNVEGDDEDTNLEIIDVIPAVFEPTRDDDV